MTIDIAEISEVVANSEIGEIIYKRIVNELSRSESLNLDFKNISVMTTYCAKQIFGRLYKEMGDDSFYQRLQFSNVSDDLKIIIQCSIEDAVDNM